MAKPKVVCPFKAGFQSRYIESKSKQYYLPKKYIEETLADLEACGFNILMVSDRTFIENYLATNALAYHSGR